MSYCSGRRNFMEEMREIIYEIDRLKPEPEVCNVRCPPLGCPRGPCPGLCCYEGICDPCCVSDSQVCRLPPPHRPRCCAPRILRELISDSACPPIPKNPAIPNKLPCRQMH